MNERVLLFGGSFNPVHRGHLAVARAAATKLKADKVYFIPCGQSAYAKALMPARLRLRLLRAALKSQAKLKVSDIEIKRRGISRSIDTVLAFKRRFPKAELFLLIGADQVPELPRWKRVSELAKLARISVAPRPGYKAPSALVGRFGLQILKIPQYDISSTEIRDKLKKHLDPKNLLSIQVRNILVREQKIS